MTVPPSVAAWPAQIDSGLAARLSDAHVARVLESSPRALIAAFQQARLESLVGHLRSRQPWWRARLAAFGPRAKLSDLPILTRADFIESLGDGSPPQAPSEHGPLLRNSSSGTSGRPLTFFCTALAQRVASNVYWDDHRRQSRRLDVACAALRGRIGPHPGRDHVEHAADPWLGELQSYVRSSSDFTIREHARWLSALARSEAGRLRYLVLQPSMLRGLLDDFASAAVEPPQGIEQVLTLGESVSDELRQACKTVLGADIRDRYSTEETGPIAFQCPRSPSHYHVAVANVVVEIVDDAGRPCPAGTIGRVLVTQLHNCASATLRYDIGDLALLAEGCPCGLDIPVLGPVIGRQRALLRLPNGERKLLRVNSRDWIEIGGIREHRITQTHLDRVKVEVVADAPLDPARLQALRSMLAQRLSDRLHYDIVVLDAIDWPPGKRQEVVGLD